MANGSIFKKGHQTTISLKMKKLVTLLVILGAAIPYATDAALFVGHLPSVPLTLPTEAIASCLKTFLSCLDREGGTLADKTKSCYREFQNCSGSIIVITRQVEGVSEGSLFECGNSNQRYYAAPSDCHSFYQCFDKVGPPVKMSCGFLHYNPIASACDWPANVINIRPECDKTFKNFGRRKQFGRRLNISSSGSATSDSSKSTSNNKVKDKEVKEPRVLIIDGKNLIPSPELKESKGIEKEDMKKKLPTILEIILRPDVFLNATYLPEGSGSRIRLSSNEINDEDDYHYDSEDEDYVIATLDELYDEVNDIYDEFELYDTAKPMKLQQNKENKSTPNAPVVQPININNVKDLGKDTFVFPVSQGNLDTHHSEMREIEELDLGDGIGNDKGRENTVFPTESARIEFPRTLDNSKSSKLDNEVDNDYTVMDMPVPNALKDVDANVVLSPHNRLFPMDPTSTSRKQVGTGQGDIDDKQSVFRTNTDTSVTENDEETCYCPCKCTEKHTDPIFDNIELTTETSRTSPHTTSDFKTKSTLINPSTLTTTTTSSLTPKTVDPTTYYPIIEENTKPRVTFFPDRSGEEMILSTEPQNKDDKEPRTLKVVKDKEYDDYLLDKLYDDVNNIYEDILGDSNEKGAESTTSKEDYSDEEVTYYPIVEENEKGLKNVRLFSTIQGQDSKQRLIPAYELLNVVEQLEELGHFQLSNGTSDQKETNNKNKKLGTTNENTKGLTDVDNISGIQFGDKINSTIQSNSFDEAEIREIVNDSIDYYLGQEDSMPSTQIAKCISTFLSCLDSENRNAVENIKETDVEGSGFTEEVDIRSGFAAAKTPATLNSTSMNCYQSFQDCSGSVILIPDLYNGTTSANQVDQLEFPKKDDKSEKMGGP